MPLRVACLALLVAASGIGASAQPVDGAASTVKRIYNLVPPATDDDLAVGALRRTEVETYGLDGRRLRVEWRDPEAALILAFMEMYDTGDQPFGAVYFEGTDLDPNLESMEYLDGGRLKRVTYFGADSVVTSINEFVLGAEGQELERRYGNAAGEIRGTDTIGYDANGNQTGYIYESTDGSRRVEYVFRIEAVDARGNWTSRVVLREGVPRSLEVREVTYAE
ncbi:MAG: hypothetical protein AAF594_18585 [Bacteroidota bacterium]